MQGRLGCARAGSASLKFGADSTAGVCTGGYCVGGAWMWAPRPGLREKKRKGGEIAGSLPPSLSLIWHTKGEGEEDQREVQDTERLMQSDRVRGRN